MDSLTDPDSEAVDPSIPILDLNDLLLDHPAASFVFRCEKDLLIVDRATDPDNGSLVIVRTDKGFAAEIYHGQDIWGVVTYHLHKSE